MTQAILPQEIIRRKRDGEELSSTEITSVAKGIADGTLSDAQVGAFAMAVYWRGMTAVEQAALTRAMAASGQILDWASAGLDGPVVDKHSTGGVGDKVSLVLAPIVAACGAYVPMISGRGLGHTGGTLDKLEAIPGYDPFPSLERFRKITSTVGCSIIGQTAELAPADRRLYAIRDVTATVEAIPLITASILSKKLAAGLGSLVMDIKVGSGAFMETVERARDLATSIIRTAAEAGVPTTVLLTDMDQVLGRTAGNALEVKETVDFLCGRKVDQRLRECTQVLAGHMLALSGLAADPAEGMEMAESAITRSDAAEKFQKMIAAHGGPSDFVDKSDPYLPPAPIIRDVYPERPGTVSQIDVRGVGLAVTVLGGGRTRPDQSIDHAVGLSGVAQIGEVVGDDRPLAVIHARDEASAENVERRLRSAFETSDHAGQIPGSVVREIIDG